MHNFAASLRKNLSFNLLRVLTVLLLFMLLMAQMPISTARAAGEQLILTKTVEGNITTAQVGDIIRYRIRFQCSSLTTPCGKMEITDVLQTGLIYMPPPDSSVPAGFTITYTGGTRTVTITKDDNNLLDGSQYDAVIAVRVDYDLRPLPNVINNTVNGRIDPTNTNTWVPSTPSSAPPITIGTANPHWAVAKTLYSPTINPTVNTNVTYRVDLCPTAPPPGQGNVPLRNIILTDTIPVGATFVSATNGGTFSAGVVTWPVFAGPIYPPSCLSRFVTIRYNTPTFSVGTDNDPDPDNNVTNRAHANADYTPSTGTCTTPCIGIDGQIDHPIDPIFETPNYSKDDVGDPVGITGTARFILNLNTNGTNFPSNNLILIDNLPPQLQVTSVTSGQWSAAFDYVRAYVGYSTNNGTSYTDFPGQPISYNTNATYAAPVANITNIRWRFEYDTDQTLPFDVGTTVQGLPFSWAFTTSPQIRITPRAAATVADPPSGAAMPAAVAGNTYNNCLQVTRNNSLGNPVTDSCNIEQMTVQGSLVSLRTSKAETPGTAWDDLSDPTITTFTADGTILPGDTVKYTITVEITERSSAPLINPTIQDTMPVASDFIFVRNGTALLDGGAVTQPTFTQVGQVLTWAWNAPSPALSVSPLPLGSHFLTVEFYARVPRGQAPGTYTNDLYVTTDSVDALCEIGTQLNDAANGDVDGDADPTDPACRNPDTYIVERSAALRGEKWIRAVDPSNSTVVDATTFLPGTCPNGGTAGLAGGGTNPFTRFPCISQAFPEGALSPGQLAPPPPAINPALDDFEYSERIFNDGNVPMLSYVLYDILPYVGDHGSGGTLESTARSSEFMPTLRGPVTFVSGPAGVTASDFTIEYNLTNNPCRPEVFDQPTGTPSTPPGCDNTWTSSWSTAVRSYRIRLNSGGAIPPATSSAEVRFGVPMYIPLDAVPSAGFDANDALSHEIAWNSFSHVGSYDKDPSPVVDMQDLLASEPRKVGITVPERMSVGNRVWRDADNSGTINAPDDTTPGIAGVVVNLYRDTDNDGVADGPVGNPTVIATTTTDSEGYYLFSNIPYDSVTMNNNRYIIGIPAVNFGVGQPLHSLRNSSGAGGFPPVSYTNPAENNGDNNDNGIDPILPPPPVPSTEVFSARFILQPTTEATSETDLSNNNRDGLAGQRRGVNGERDNNSDLTKDFGFFGGDDIPFSIGNHVWKDNGQGAGGVINDGIRQSGEPPVANVLVRLYRDGDLNGIATPAELIRTDTTDAGGFYLFDDLDPGHYFVEIAASNFTTGQPLAGWYSSQPTGTETTGVNGLTTTADIDNDDNGINAAFPENTGVFSGMIDLAAVASEPTGESYLSSDSSVTAGFNPTAGDGPTHYGRFGEVDNTSNMTIDFGFIPPMSLGNRVWIDQGSGTASLRTDFDNGIHDAGEPGVSGVTVQLWRDMDGTPGLQIATDSLMYTTTTDATGYYLFERLQPGANYFVHLPLLNFTGAGPLVNYLSSTDTAAPVDDSTDKNDNGVDSATPNTTGISSQQIAMAYNTEPLNPPNETDLNISGTYGPLNVGTFGQQDGDSNLTQDFGFVLPPRSIGNRLWIDANNNGVLDGGESPVPTGVRVSLYRDSNGNGLPDDVNGDTVLDGNDALGFDLTDVNGYYLFDHVPPGRYIVGVDYTNFTGGGSLVGYNSSRGSVDNASNNTDSLDNGLDRLQIGNPAVSPYGVISTSIDLRNTPVNAPTGETGSGDTSTTVGFNPTAGDGTNSRGRFGETDLNSDLTIDFGFFIPMSIGNRVFKDDGAGAFYNDGIMDGAETPVANVRVELWHDVNTDGNPDVGGFMDFDTTDAGGYYLFDDLAPGSYVVVIPFGNFTASFDPDGGGPLPTAAGPLLGYDSSTPTGTENTGVAGDPYTPNTDRDDNGFNGVTAPITGGVHSGAITLAYTTEATGESELSGQADPGSPANLAFDATGWDGPLSRGRWGESDGNSNLTIDFGFIPVFSLGNRIFSDTDNDRTRDLGVEGGINGVRVHLFASDGTTEIPVGPDGILHTSDDNLNGMVTAGGGYYLFNNLPAGDYIVVVSANNFAVGGALRGYWSSGTTMDSAGVVTELAAFAANNDTDSDDNGALSAGRVVSTIVTLGPTITSEPASEPDLDSSLPGNRQGQPDRQANMTVDLGFYKMVLGDVVWLDNGAGAGGIVNDGIQNGTEAGINGVTVQLWTQDLSTMLGTTTTSTVLGVSGTYSFTGLVAGNYVVRLPATNFNSGGPLQNYRSSTGAVPPSTYEPAPNPDVVTVNSDDNGTETGGRLGAGGYIQTSVFAMTPRGEQNFDDNIALTTENRVDFGLTELVGIGNRVWLDNGGTTGIANNGIMDGDEVGVNGVVVQLYDAGSGLRVQVGSDGILGTADDAADGPVTTSAGGYYSFDRLFPGQYYVLIPASEFASGKPLETYYSSAGNDATETRDEATAGATDDNGIDNAAPATNGIRSITFALTPGGESITDVDTNYTGTLADANVNFTDDFGFTQKYSIGNRIWLDTDNSSTINGSEVGKDGVVVNLYAASNLAVILATDTTSSGGYYLFDDLYPGDYVVSVAASNFTGPGVLTGYWSSATSRDGVGAITETTAALANSDTESDDNGTRQTSGALNGAVISSTITLGPSGLTEPTIGAPSFENGFEPVIGQGNQADGRANMTVDFGFYRVEIGNLVFADADVSGHYNAGDTLLQSVAVQLYASNGTTLITSTSTNASGIYDFDGQPVGDYIIKVVTPTGMTSTIDTFDSADNANPDVNTDMNDNGIGQGAGTVASGTLTMIAAESATNITVTNATGTTTDTTVDFGFVPLYSLGNRVWLDLNNNGLMDGGEDGKDGVVVELYHANGAGNPTGAVVATDTTSSGPLGLGYEGFYRFDDLFPGDYVVVITKTNFASGNALAGYWSSGTTLSTITPGAIIETPAPDADLVATDADDNGTRDTSGGAFDGAVLSKAVTLGPSGGTEPTGEIATQLESGVLGNQGNEPDDHANMTVDFGFYFVSVGNQVYLDNNFNGNYDGAPDTALAGVTVKLYAFNGTTEIPVGPDGILGTADDAPGGRVTNPAGFYVFSGLPEGQYIVTVVPSAGLASTIDTYAPATTDNANPNINFDNNDNGIGTGIGTVSSGIVTLTPGSTGALGNNSLNTPVMGATRNPTVDFGFVGLVAIGNRVWFDTGAGAFYNNGILDAGETGVSGLRVELYTSANVFVAFTTTDASGYYQFDQLYPGTYYVMIPATQFQAGKPLETYYSTVGNGINETSDETVDENGIDDATPATNGIRTPNYVLTPGTEQAGEGQSNYTGVLPDNSVNFTADFGFVHLVAIGNRIWFDDGTGGGTPNDGKQNGSEAGVPSVSVELYHSGDTPGVTVPVATTATDASGNYQFDLLSPGQYFVHIPASQFQTGGALAGYVSSTGNGSDETSDQDTDENGVDAVSLPTTGISTPVYDLQPNTETTTDDQTSYTGYLTDDNVNFTADFGFLQKVAIGNVIWLDNGAGGGTANDGKQNGSEPGISGVDLQLYHVGDTPGSTTPVKTTTTGASGYYVFDDLLPGDYFIYIPPAEFQTGGTLANYQSSTGNGIDETTDQTGDENGIDDATPATNGIRSTDYTLQPNTEATGEPQPNYTGALDDDNVNFTADFGFTELVALGNRVWFDTGAGAFYNNGILDAGEAGVDNVTVQLFTSAGVEVPVGPDGILGTADDAAGGMVTSGGGYYRFDRLYPGAYYVQIPASEFQAGGQLLGYVSSLGAGADETNDNNADENGMDVATLTTTGIKTQNYTLLPNTEQTLEDQSNYVGALDDDNVNFTADFGFTELVALGNRIWFDDGTGGGTPNDGKQNVGELGASNVDVELYRVGDTPGVTVPVATTATDGSGNYQFDNLNPGDYFVHIPASEFQSGQPLFGAVSSTGNGSDETSDQDADENGIDAVSLPTTGINSTPYTLTPNTETTTDDESSYTTGYLDDDNVNFTADFGFLQKVAIGNVIWLDNGAGGGIANDGKQNGSEPGISGVDLELYHVGDTPGSTTPVKTTTSGASGYYVFDDLLPGDYFIYIPPAEFQTGGTLANYQSSTGNGSDETTDQAGDENGIDDAAPATNGIRSTDYTLQPNTEVTGEPQPNYTGALDDDNVNFTTDFGFTELVAIGNRVWFDTGAGAFYNNGILDAGETGVSGVRVELYTGTGTFVNFTTTNVSGYYQFDRLYPGTYYVQIPASAFQAGGQLLGYVSSLGAGADETNDNTADENGMDVATLTTTGIKTQNYTLLPNTEQTLEDQSNYAGALDDDNVNFTADFGFTELVALGNRIWFDDGTGGGTPNDGKQNGGELGAVNVDVELYRVGDTPGVTVPVATTTTDGSGNYQFDNLNPGDYFVHIPASEFQSGQPLFGAVSSTGNGSDETSDQDADENGIDAVSLPTTGINSTPYTLTPNTETTTDDESSYTTGYLDDDNVNFTADFGFLQKVAIGNVIWLDNGAGGGIANDGKQNGGEPGISGVDLQLYHVGDTPGSTTPVKTTTTGASGYYVFDDLLPGNYFVYIPPAEFQTGGTLDAFLSSTSNGNDETTDQTGDENGIDDAAPATNGIRSTNYDLQPNSEATGEPQPNYTGALDDDNVNFTADFGFTESYSIGNRVWFDTNNDSLLDTVNEKGVNNVTVELYASDLSGNPTGAALQTTTTDTNGYYLFNNLYGGDYVVVLPAANFTGIGPLVGYWSSATTISTAGLITETTANDADSNTSDTDDNGTKQTAGTFTGAVISQDVVLGPTGSTEPTGETDLKVGVGQGNQPDGRANMTVDFGFYTQTLGNLVWSDINKDGHYDSATESGIDGISVELWSGDGSIQLTTLTTTPVTTGGAFGTGKYLFTGLPQGNYVVRVTAPPGTVSSVDTYNVPGDTGNPNLNADDNDNGVGTGSGTVSSSTLLPVTLTPGSFGASNKNVVTLATGDTFNPTIDFGFTPVFSLGNRVWFDTDNSGTINGTEVGISGVNVHLFASDGATEIPVGPDGILNTADDNTVGVTTDANGYYLFNNLPAGDYLVRIPSANFGVGQPLNGYWSSTSRLSTGGIIETTAPDADNVPPGTDSDDNGTLVSGNVDSSVVTLGPTASEPVAPADENDIPASGQGQPDAQANMTVDFGFYTMTLGNLVWNDNGAAAGHSNNGVWDSTDEFGIPGVTVELWSGDGSTEIKVGLDGILGTTDDGPGGMPTNGSGIYTFTGLPAGDYIVRLPASNFNPTGILRDYRSSTGPLPGIPYETAALMDADTNTVDQDDNGLETNGLLGLGGYIQTLPVTLTPAGEASINPVTYATVEDRVDFGVNKSPQIDLIVTKTDNQAFYAAGGTLTYKIVVTNKGPADAGDPGTPTLGTGMNVSDPLPPQILSWTWTCDTPGVYGCDGGTAAPFADELFLPQLASVSYTVVAQVKPTATGNLINAVTVTPPSSMTDLVPPDNTATDIDKPASLTVDKDDGVQIVAPGAVLTYTINVTNNGASDLTGILLTDTIPTGTTFTSATGFGTFAAGKVTWPLFDLIAGATTQRQVVVTVANEATLKAGNITTLTNDVDAKDDGKTTGGTPLDGKDRDIDRVLLSDVKSLTGTNQSGSTDPHVLIGEILTYTIKLDVPPGTIKNLQAVDLLDHGLAFVGCDATNPITSTGLTLLHNPCTDPAYLKVQAIPVTDTNPKSENAGRRATFTFGRVQNATATTQSLLVTYQVVVLDIKSNVDGTKELNNKVTWSWEGGKLSGSATDVDVVEPDLSIKKTVDHEIATIGSVLTYSIEVEHTKKSHAPAYDVVVADNLPAGLLLDPATIKVKNSTGLPTPVIKTTTNGFTVYWASFPIGEKTVITFQAKFIGPSPVVNKTNVVWSSIPVVPNPPGHRQSVYNDYSTERRYDPKDDTLNNYVTESSISIRTPGGLPNTGFAPGVQTILPVQPLNKAYDPMTDMWLEIPALGLNMPIIGVPATGSGWDLTWLSNQAGYLEGTTYPTQVGTTGLTGHVYLADGTPGPFVHLADLIYGNQVILHANGKRYIYEVRTSKVVVPGDLSVFKNDGYTWLTLLTCKDYIPSLNRYDYRLAVRAVLITVDDDTSASSPTIK